jgi:hypothetical protein
MIRVQSTSGDTHHKCSHAECPIHWNPAVTIFYLKTTGDWPLQDSPDPK